MSDSLRNLPSVEKLMQALGPTDLPRPMAVEIVRERVAAWRKELKVPEFGEALEEIRSRLRKESAYRLQGVINGTGILLHTNLGRAPLGKRVLERVLEAAGQYSNLEFDLVTGERGSRARLLEKSLAALCEAPAATVVNNCAAALVLVLRHFTAQRPEVIISRGELVQIGGGFRIPDILEASGAKLREVGTTNKTSVQDYARAMSSSTGLILRVHRSNFLMSGFVEFPSRSELKALAKEKDLPLVEDLGSGALVPTEEFTESLHEPTPAEVLKGGVDLVCFSGDKLMGGPQCGIIAGRADWIKGIKGEPFFRALRCDKLVLSALEATVEIYLSNREREDVPILSMLHLPLETLRMRAQKMVSELADLPAKVEISERPAEMGGGTLPETPLAAVQLAVRPAKISVEDLAAKLREQTPPIIGCIFQGNLHLHLRTIFPEQDAKVAGALRKVLGS